MILLLSLSQCSTSTSSLAPFFTSTSSSQSSLSFLPSLCSRLSRTRPNTIARERKKARHRREKKKKKGELVFCACAEAEPSSSSVLPPRGAFSHPVSIESSLPELLFSLLFWEGRTFRSSSLGGGGCFPLARLHPLPRGKKQMRLFFISPAPSN